MRMKKANNMAHEWTSLAGQFLIAMPGIDDVRFDKAVVYILEHTPEKGAVGLVINRPAEQLTFEDILKQLHLPLSTHQQDIRILLGGPAETSRGFVLHSGDWLHATTLAAGANSFVTSTQEVLEAIADHTGPSHFLIALGCATWIAGQLEDEVMDNVWLTTPADPVILFQTPYHERWKRALERLGVNALYLSSDFGKA